MNKELIAKFRREIAEYIFCIDHLPIINYLYIDLDNCQQYNEYYGHENVDIFIAEICNKLTEFSKKYDGKCVRTGGDEFSLIIPGKAVDNAMSIGTQINAFIRNVNLFELAKGIDFSSAPESCKYFEASIASVMYPLSNLRTKSSMSKVEYLEENEVKMLWKLTEVMMLGIKGTKNRGQCVTLSYV